MTNRILCLTCFVLLACRPPEGGTDGGVDGGVPDGGSDGGLELDAATDAGLLGARVTTESGEVMGETDDDLVIFRGIPYAAPPVAELRWRPPQPYGEFDGVHDATSFGAMCPQYDGDALVGDEDCLFLNVWAPRAEGPRPVMVFIHGGSFTAGAGSVDLYESSLMARQGDVVVVTINYRLGPLGYLNAEALAAEADGAVGNYVRPDRSVAVDWAQHRGVRG